MEEGAGHADTQALLHRHGLLHVQPVAPVLSQGPCGGTRISRSPAPRSPLTCPQQWQQQQQRPHLSDPGVSGRPGSEEGRGSPVGGGAAGRPAEAGEEPGTHRSQKRNLRAEASPHSAQSPWSPLGPETRGPAQRGADQGETPFPPPISGAALRPQSLDQDLRGHRGGGPRESPSFPQPSTAVDTRALLNSCLDREGRSLTWTLGWSVLQDVGSRGRGGGVWSRRKGGAPGGGEGSCQSLIRSFRQQPASRCR